MAFGSWGWQPHLFLIDCVPHVPDARILRLIPTWPFTCCTRGDPLGLSISGKDGGNSPTKN